MDNLTTFFTSLALLITAMAGVIVATIKAYKSTKKEVDTLPRKIKRQIPFDNVITDKLDQVKELLNADRVQVYDFHNGGHYANGRSALKTTCTFEVCRAGIRPYQAQLQGVPLSCVSKFISELLDNGELEVKDIEKIRESMPATYTLKKSSSVRAFYDIVINNPYGEAVGFLAIQYVKNPYSIKTEEDKQKVLKVKFFVEEQIEKMKEGK